MTTIGNRFGALLLNASGPTDQKTKNEKPKKKSEKVKGSSAPKSSASLKSDAPENGMEKSAAGPPSTVTNNDHWHNDVEDVNHVSVSEKRLRREAAVAGTTSSGVQTKRTNAVTVTDCTRNTRQAKHERRALPDDGICEVPRKAPLAKALNNPEVIVTDNLNPAQLEDELDDTKVVDSLSKDDRSSITRQTYQKRLINAGGRVYDRRGPPEIRVKAVEKRGGRGAYNWGDQTDQTGVPIGETGEDARLDDAYNKGDRETNQASAADTNVVEYTIAEYKEMLINKKVFPVYRDATGKIIPIDGAVAVGSNHVEVTQNIAKPHAEHQRGHSDRFPEKTSDRRQPGFTSSDRPRSSRRMPDFPHKSRHHLNENVCGEGAKRSQSKKVIRLDDMSDFPSL